jgi:hypothetical protein
VAFILGAEHDVRIELDDTAATAELLGFLRSFDCSAQAVGPRLLEVEFEHAPRPELTLALTRAGLCGSCGGPVAPALAELGSRLCHDCRDGGDGCARLDRIRLDAFMGVWNALHPTALATLRDEQPVPSG